ncbi:MAG: hypothetical protein ACRDK9_01910 [Solirubrobacterales bacterium]
MKDARTNGMAHRPAARRAQRRAEGLVAEYIHELSDRHAGARSRAGSLARRTAIANASPRR